jgi:hypothetical protein
MSQRDDVLSFFLAEPNLPLDAKKVQAKFMDTGRPVPQPSIRRCLQELYKKLKLDLSTIPGHYVLRKEM